MTTTCDFSFNTQVIYKLKHSRKRKASIHTLVEKRPLDLLITEWL